MKKSRILSFVLALFTLCSAVTLTACGGSKHEHTFKSEWASNATEHWHECEGEDCEEVSDKGAHVYDNACDKDCNVCGATREISYYTTSYDNIHSYMFLGDENIVGVAGGQYVFKLPIECHLDDGNFFLHKDKNVAISSYEDAVSSNKYILRFFNDKFEEIPLVMVPYDTGDCKAYHVDSGTETTNLVNEYRDKVVYMMVTLTESVTFCPACN